MGIVWEKRQQLTNFSRKRASDPHSKRRLADEQTMRSLEERIANLEVIASHSELDMQHQLKQLESQKRTE